MKISRKWSAKEGDVHASSVSVGLVGLMYIALHMAIKELWLDQHSRIHTTKDCRFDFDTARQRHGSLKSKMLRPVRYLATP
jgi:hypothetical protein